MYRNQGLMKAAQPFEIPLDIDIEFQVIKLPDEKMKQIQEDTRYFAENMDESDIKHYRSLQIHYYLKYKKYSIQFEYMYVYG